MTDDDDDTEPYTSPEEMRYLEQDEAWDKYAQTSAPITTSAPLTHKRVRRARQQIRPLPTTLPATPNVVKVDTPNFDYALLMFQ